MGALALASLLAVGLLATPSIVAASEVAHQRWAVLVYDGIGTEAGGLVLGRVIADRGLDEPKSDESTLRKMRRLRRLLFSEPLPRVQVDVRIGATSKRVRTDARGFFQWRVPGPLPVGTHHVRAQLVGGLRQRQLPGRLQIFPTRPGTLWISDLDDTVLHSDVRHKLRMVQRLLSRNALELRSYKGAAALLHRGRRAGVALAFVSGSPWQLQPRLRRFLRHRGLPRAPLFLKRIGLGADADALMDQGAYKRRQLERLLTLLPGYRVVCFGDSGERDPEVYRALQRRHPKRVLAVLIHDVGGLRAKDPRVAGQVRFRLWAQAQRWLETHDLLPQPPVLPEATTGTTAQTTATPKASPKYR